MSCGRTPTSLNPRPKTIRVRPGRGGRGAAERGQVDAGHRILGRRQAVVEDVPGVTGTGGVRRPVGRSPIHHCGHRRVLPDARDRAAAIAAQAEIAAATADVICSGRRHGGRAGRGRGGVRMLRRTNKPVILVANKVDNQAQELESRVSGRSGSASRTRFPHCTDADRATCSTRARRADPRAARDRPRTGGPRRVALVGRPNWASRAAQPARQEERAAWTRGRHHGRPVDSLVTSAARPGCCGHRGCGGGWVRPAARVLRSLRTAGAIEAAEVAVVLLDASEPISERTSG